MLYEVITPKDAEFFERARDMEFKHALVTAFGATCRVQGGPEDDANIERLLARGVWTPVTTFSAHAAGAHWRGSYDSIGEESRFSVV